MMSNMKSRPKFKTVSGGTVLVCGVVSRGRFLGLVLVATLAMLLVMAATHQMSPLRPILVAWRGAAVHFPEYVDDTPYNITVGVVQSRSTGTFTTVGYESLLPDHKLPGGPRGGDRLAGKRLPTAETTRSVEIPSVHVSAVNCANLFKGDPAEQDRAADFHESHTASGLTEDGLFTLLQDCDKFRRTRAYPDVPLSREEARFPLAFSILVFTDTVMVERLLRAIYQSQNYYCIHVDRKSSYMEHEIISALARCFPNVVKASQSIDVQWGFYSVLEPELICMKELIRFKKWKYLINLTGQEFPLKTNLELVRILDAFNGSNDMEAVTKGQNTYDKQRTRYVHVPGIGMTDRTKTPPPYGVTIVKGAVHITVQRGFVDFVLSNPKAHVISEWLKDAGHPDEIFFSTLNYNPQLGTPGAYLGPPETNWNKPFLSRYKEWQYFGYKCHGEWVRAICVFGVGDLPTMTKRRELFVNKFHLDLDPLAYDCMEEWHFNRTRLGHEGEDTLDLSFYSGLDMVSNHI